MAITISYTLFLTFYFLPSHFDISYAITCANHKFTSNRIYTSCKDLPHLQAKLHWTYNSTVGVANIAYRARQGAGGWVAWAINPNQIGMVGSEALVAFVNNNNNGGVTVYPTMITSYNPSMLPADLSFRVSGLSAEFLNNEITIYATVGPFGGGSVVNQVWQAGNLVIDGVPQMHAVSQQNLQSTGELDFSSD